VSVGARAIAAWLVLLVLMFANGAARVVVLQPRLGEDGARQVASLTGLGVVLLLSWAFVRSSRRATPSELRRVGAAWLALTIAFELLFGRFVSGMSWSALLADYDVRRGRLWPLILVGVLLGPSLWGALRSRGGEDAPGGPSPRS
jgi:hypothetical protein